MRTVESFGDRTRYPFHLVSTDVNVVPVGTSPEELLKACMLVSTDLYPLEDMSGNDHVMITLTYADTPESLYFKRYKTIDLVFKKEAALPVAVRILAAAKDDPRVALMQEYVYAENLRALKKRHFRKIKFLYSADNANDLGSQIINFSQEGFEEPQGKIQRFH
jgi:hypothetical protein